MIRPAFRSLLPAFCLIVSGCELDLPFLNEPYASEGLQSYFRQNLFKATQSGQARFLLDDFGSLNAKGLINGNIIPIKVYFTALLMADDERSKRALNSRDVPAVMERYGFIRPASFANWRSDLAPAPALPMVSGFIRSTIDFPVPWGFQPFVKIRRARLEVGNITCAACHSGVTYDATGAATKAVWLGAPNSSLNIDGFFDQIYRGLKLGMADKKAFLRKIRQAYPQLDALEEKTIAALLPMIDKELAKYKKGYDKTGVDRVLNFPNGGPGLTNGIGAFKRLIHPKTKYEYHPDEAGIVSIPDISYRGFRSSFTYDGAYGIPDRPRFERVDAVMARDPERLDRLAELAAFFTFSAMGNNIKNIEGHIPRVQQVFQDFLKDLEPPRFPGAINTVLAGDGRGIFTRQCATCHGTYDASLERPKLLSFPNRFVEQEELGTDKYRWWKVDGPVKKFTTETVFAKYIDAGHAMGGYSAPILSGVWYTAPYLHNGSVPTLWQLMNPSERAVKFELGGHALDYEQVGIAGRRTADGQWLYREGYTPWAAKGLYDTTRPGQSNAGHERPFTGLTASEKRALIEYLKLL